jgi:hypothetical protein
LLCCVAVAAGVVRDAEDAEASCGDALAEALEANRRLSELAVGLTGENARLRAELAQVLARDAERDAELEKLRADLAVLQRMLFGRSSERSRPEPPASVRGFPIGRPVATSHSRIVSSSLPLPSPSSCAGRT